MMAAEIVKALGGRNGQCRCPAHDDASPSLSVTERDGRLLTHCFAGCSPEAVWQALADRGLVGTNDDRVSSPAPAEPVPDRRAEAFAIWKAAVPALHTPAEAYLKARGITTEPPKVIRYHAHDNALVAAVSRPDGGFGGVQRIYLTGDGYSSKFSLGPLKGGAVRLTPPAPSLQLTESVEDGLALLQMTGRPTWACLGTSMLASFEPPPEVREVVLAPDADAAGKLAIEKATANLEGKVRLRKLLPPEGIDWCDVLEDHDERQAIQEEPRWVEGFCNGV